jgi:hypothetical protein
MKFLTAIAVVGLLTHQQPGANAFAVRTKATPRMTTTAQQLLSMVANDKEEASSSNTRRNFFAQSSASVTAAVAVTAGIWSSSLLVPPQPAVAAVSGVTKVNAKLLGFGLPPIPKVPDGFSPLLETYGKGKNRDPLLVTFSHPLSWVVTLPSNNVNGEDGTIQAGDYGKGDTATLYVYTDKGGVGDITKQPKELIETVLKRSISLRGDNMYQNFKLTKLTEGTVAATDGGSVPPGQSYMLADFKYQLLTGAGFEVDRKGVAAITSQGKAVQVLWAASTDARYKKTQDTLRNIVQSFRCYADGLNFAEELVSFNEQL